MITSEPAPDFKEPDDDEMQIFCPNVTVTVAVIVKSSLLAFTAWKQQQSNLITDPAPRISANGIEVEIVFSVKLHLTKVQVSRCSE
jgi:hypothetical protein